MTKTSPGSHLTSPGTGGGGGGGRCLCEEQLLSLLAKTESGTLLADFPQEGKGTGKFIHCSQVFFMDKIPISLAG